MGYRCQCHRCQRIFYADDLGEYVYKKNGFYFCSWTCYRRYEQALEFQKREELKAGKKHGKTKTVSS